MKKDEEYHRLRYLELLNEEQSLKKRGLSFYEENRERYFELLTYEIQLMDYQFWQSRKKYFSIVKNFLNGKLTADNFTDEFLWLWHDDQLKVSRDYKLHKPSRRFSKWLNDIFFCCEDFDDEAEEDEEYGPEWLKNEIRDRFIQIQKEYNFNEDDD